MLNYSVTAFLNATNVNIDTHSDAVLEIHYCEHSWRDKCQIDFSGRYITEIQSFEHAWCLISELPEQ